MKGSVNDSGYRPQSHRLPENKDRKKQSSALLLEEPLEFRLKSRAIFFDKEV